MIEPKKSADKVLILGTASTWKNAPLGDFSWEVWCSNAGYETWKKCSTRWFEIHHLPELYREGWHYFKWLTTYKKPIYMKKHYVIFPTSIEFPIKKVSKGYLKIYSSTFCYQMALAIHEGFKKIGLYGIDLSNGSLRERIIECRGLLYWIGVAMGKGIEVEIDKRDKTRIEHRYLYGMEYWKEVFDVQFQILRGMYATSSIDGVGKIKGIWVNSLRGDYPIE